MISWLVQFVCAHTATGSGSSLAVPDVGSIAWCPSCGHFERIRDVVDTRPLPDPSLRNRHR